MAMRNQKDSQQAFEKYLEKRFSLGLQQRLVLLLKREEKRICEFRLQWNMPKKGFKDEKEWKNWWDNLEKIVPEKVKDVEYIEFEIYYLFNKFYPEKMALSIDTEEYPRITRIKKNPQAVFDLEVKKLLLELKIDQDFHVVVRDYIWFGKAFVESIANTGIIVSERITQVPQMGELERRISLVFSANTDEQDLRDIYKYFVKGFQQTIKGYLKGKIKGQKEFERNLKIITLYNDGKRAKEIATILADEGISLDDSYIRKIIKRIKAY